ncbi:hypothetical protein [Chitinasiproducens palmae]|nr:hypothetical protein [Chitinasiproducens palmae]
MPQASRCRGVSYNASHEAVEVSGDRDRDLLAELRDSHCDGAALQWHDCQHDMLKFGALLDEARTLPRAQLRERIRTSDGVQAIALPFFTQQQQAVGIMPKWPARGDALTDAFAERFAMHSWCRLLRHHFLQQPDAATALSSPLAAFDAVSNWAGCEPAFCGVAAARQAGVSPQVPFLATLLIALARNDTLYAPLASRPGGRALRPGLVPSDATHTVFQQYLSDTLWYAEKETALAVNPAPQVPDARTLRFDGVSFRGADGLSYARDAAVLDGAAPYACQRLPGGAAAVDRLFPIGTLKHTLRSVLNLLSGSEIDLPPGENEALFLAHRLVQAIAAWRAELVHTTVHPGWLVAQHLAYSSGIEPLSMPQLRRLWQHELYPRYAAKLDRFLRTPADQSPWLRTRLSLLPQLCETPGDQELISWIHFLRDDLPRQIGLVDGDGNDVETRRLWTWRLPWHEDGLVFYRTPAEHFHIIAAYFVERMQSLLVEANLWTLDAAASAAEEGDVRAFNNLTSWLGTLRDEQEAPVALALAQVQVGGDRKAAGLRAAMQRFRDALLAHPAVQANAAEALREAQASRSPISIRARAHALVTATRKPSAATTHHVFTVATLVGMLPVVGTVRELAHDISGGHILSSLIDGAELYLQVADVYGTAVDTLFSEEVTGCLQGGSAQLAEDDLRSVPLPDEGRAAQVVRRGAVYQELEEGTGAVIDDAAIIGYEPLAGTFRQVVLREIREATQLPPHRRYTVRVAEQFLVKLVKYTDRRGGFDAAFGARFAFSETSPPELTAAVLEAYAFFERHSPTFRRLFASGRDDGKKWTIHVSQGNRFRTVFGEHNNNLGENRIELGTNLDAEQIVYTSVSGEASMTYWRAVLHELVHAMTGLCDTAFDAFYDRQDNAVRRIRTHLDTLSPPMPGGAILSLVRRRRRRALQRTLLGAQGILDQAHLGMAEQRGPVVYFVDRILQECKTGWPERVMYLAGPRADTKRLGVMAAQRVGAATRMHEENDRLDRLWLNGLEVSADMLFSGEQLVRERAAVREWQSFVDKVAKRGVAPPGNWLDVYLFAPTYQLRAEAENQINRLLLDASNRSPTFKTLIQAWRVFSSGTRFWTFAMLGSDRRLVNPDARYIDVSDDRFIMTALGPQRASLARRVISGTVALLLHDIGFTMPADALRDRRWLGVLVEQRVLDELSLDEMLRVNGAMYPAETLSANEVGAISELRRAALLEDHYIETLISPRTPAPRPAAAAAAR